jgi:hypothetical protein
VLFSSALHISTYYFAYLRCMQKFTQNRTNSSSALQCRAAQLLVVLLVVLLMVLLMGAVDGCC